MEVAEFMQGAQQYLPMLFLLSEWRKGFVGFLIFFCLFVFPVFGDAATEAV